ALTQHAPFLTLRFALNASGRSPRTLVIQRSLCEGGYLFPLRNEGKVYSAPLAWLLHCTGSPYALRNLSAMNSSTSPMPSLKRIFFLNSGEKPDLNHVPKQ